MKEQEVQRLLDFKGTLLVISVTKVGELFMYQGRAVSDWQATEQQKSHQP